MNVTLLGEATVRLAVKAGQFGPRAR